MAAWPRDGISLRKRSPKSIRVGGPDRVPSTQNPKNERFRDEDLLGQVRRITISPRPHPPGPHPRPEYKLFLGTGSRISCRTTMPGVTHPLTWPDLSRYRRVRRNLPQEEKIGLTFLLFFLLFFPFFFSSSSFLLPPGFTISASAEGEARGNLLLSEHPPHARSYISHLSTRDLR